MKLSSQEKTDLDKFIKFWALKSAQIIVQARQGEKASIPSNPQNTVDWFNLNITDAPDVLMHVKRALKDKVLSSSLPLCVETSLRTGEGDQMALETWCLGISPENCDPAARIVHTVYNRLVILLKSLISVTRAVPAYKLSRRQGSDSFIMCYRIYLGEPQVHGLGEGYKNLRIGQVATPMGTLQLSVFYRIKMTISPTQTGKDNSIMLKSDHFNNFNAGNKSDEKIPTLSETMKIGAFADCRKKSMFENEIIFPSAPFSKLFTEKISPDKHSETSENILNDIKNESKKEEEKEQKKEGSKKQEETNGNVPAPNPNPLASLESRLGDMMLSSRDDFIMVDLKTPFASSSEKVELSKFYREWQAAPPLQEFVELPPLEELDITKQLETFESDLNEYDSIVQSLCQSPNNN